MGWVGGVDAALVAGIRAAPDAGVVALFYLHGGELGARAVGGADGGDACLCELLALVDPDCAAEDGEVFGLVDVDHVSGALLLVLGCDVDHECHAAEVEGPAALEEEEYDVFAIDVVWVLAGWHYWAEGVAVGSWGYFHPFGG